MTRLATTFDRLAALVFGLALIAIGAGLLVWNTNVIPGTPEMITARGLVTAAGTDWWPWAVAGVGVVLVLTALRWLFVHTPKAKVKALRLSAGDAGSVSANLGEVADAAARALELEPRRPLRQRQSGDRPRHPYHRSRRHRVLTHHAQRGSPSNRHGQ